MNSLLFGDNLKWLRDTKIFPDASVDRDGREWVVVGNLWMAGGN